MLGTIVDTQALLRTVAAAFVAGVGVTLIFSIAIAAGARFIDMSRGGRAVAAALYGMVALAALAGAGTAVTIGIIVMTQK